MKYKSIKMVHTELSIADNLINKFTGRKRHFFFFTTLWVFLSFTCTEMSCGSCCSQSSCDIEEMFYQGLKHVCAPGRRDRYSPCILAGIQSLCWEGKSQHTVSEQSPSTAAISVPAEEHSGEFSQRNTLPCHSWTQIPATQMQSHIIKRPLSPGVQVAGGDARSHTLRRCKPLEAGQFWGLTAVGLSRHFPAMSSGLMSGFFFPEDFGKIAPAFPCMFQSDMACQSLVAASRAQGRFPRDAWAG